MLLEVTGEVSRRHLWHLSRAAVGSLTFSFWHSLCIVCGHAAHAVADADVAGARDGIAQIAIARSFQDAGGIARKVGAVGALGPFGLLSTNVRP